MIRRYSSITLCAAALLASVLAPAAKAQLWTWTKDQMIEYTKAWTGVFWFPGAFRYVEL